MGITLHLGVLLSIRVTLAGGINSVGASSMADGEGKVRYPVKVLQLTDTHLYESPEGRLLGVNTAQSLSEVVSLVLKTKGDPDLVLLTGDLSQDETAGSYVRLVHLVRDIPAPKYFLPGNHDRLSVMEAVFSSGEHSIELNRSFIVGTWQFIMLDSTIPGKVGGHLAESELRRLDETLTKHPDLHAAVCVHHHPLSVDCQWIDRIGVDNGDELFAHLKRHSQVRVVIWGHIHQQYDGRRDGIALMATPSTCVQFRPRTPDFGVDGNPPGCRWIELSEDGRIKTEVLRLDHLPEGLNVDSAGY